MSIELSDVLVKKFETELIEEFQDGGKLRNTVRVRDAQGGNQIQFQVLGSVVANERTSIQTPIPTADATHTPATATVKNYTVSEMTDIFLNNQVGFDERQELVTTINMALERRLDQVIIDAMDAASLSKTVASNISGTADNLNVAMFAKAGELLGSDVPDMDRHLLCHDSGYYHFIQEGDVKTIDSNAIKPLVNGQIGNYFGFDIHKVGDRSEGGLPLSSTNRTNYAWQRSAIGLALNMQPRVEINYEPSYGAHRVTGFLSAGAVVIQTDGVVEITTDES